MRTVICCIALVLIVLVSALSSAELTAQSTQLADTSSTAASSTDSAPTPVSTSPTGNAVGSSGVNDSEDMETIRDRMARNIRPGITPSSGTAQEKQPDIGAEVREFKAILNIDEGSEPSQPVVRKLLWRKQTDPYNFNNIVRITERTVIQSKTKERLVGELVDMDRSFIESFYKRTNQPQKNNVEAQVESYLNSVENPGTLAVNLDDKVISQAIINNKDFDAIIAEIWA